MATKRAKKPTKAADLLLKHAEKVANELGPPGRIVDATVLVLYSAVWTREGLPEGGQKDLNYNLGRFVQAIAKLDDFNMAREIRQAIDTVIKAVLRIGWLQGGYDTVLHERKHGPSERAAPMYEDKKSEAEARRELELEIIAKMGWSLNKKGGRLAEQLREAVLKRTGELLSLITIKRDLAILRKRAKVSQGL